MQALFRTQHITIYDARRIVNVNELRCDFHRLKDPLRAVYKINRQTGSVIQVDGPLKTMAPIPFHQVIRCHCAAFYDNSSIVDINLNIEAQRLRVPPEFAAPYVPIDTLLNTTVMCVSNENIDGGLFEVRVASKPHKQRELSPAYMVAMQAGLTWGFTVARSFDNRNDGLRDIFVVSSRATP